MHAEKYNQRQDQIGRRARYRQVAQYHVQVRLHEYDQKSDQEENGVAHLPTIFL
jgi:hypothetical protein